MATPTPKLSRVQRIVLPILRGHTTLTNQVSTLSELEGVKVGSWGEDIDFRVFPAINIRRIGGTRNRDNPELYGLPVIEMTAYTAAANGGDLTVTEDLYDVALEVLYGAQRAQTQTPNGYIQSVFETMGATQFSSLYQDSWRIQGLIQLGIRPPRST